MKIIQTMDAKRIRWFTQPLQVALKAWPPSVIIDRLPLILILFSWGMAPAWGATAVMVQDFEKASLQPTVWVVNIPNENASVSLSADPSHDGKQCLKLHYRFVDTGRFQYLGIPNKVNIQTPVRQLRFWLKGDNSKCSHGLQVTDAGGETHQYR